MNYRNRDMKTKQQFIIKKKYKMQKNAEQVSSYFHFDVSISKDHVILKKNNWEL